MVNQLEDIQEEIEYLHSDFLKRMFFDYGMTEVPSPIMVRLHEGHLSTFGFPEKGSKESPEISIKRQPIQDTEFYCAHETAHYLHYLVLNQKFSNSQIFSGKDKLNGVARELVAEIGTHLFYRKIGKKIPPSSKNVLTQLLYPFIDRNRMGLKNYLDFDIENFRERTLLESVATQRDWRGIFNKLKEMPWGSELVKDLIKYGVYIANPF